MTMPEEDATTTYRAEVILASGDKIAVPFDTAVRDMVISVVTGRTFTQKEAFRKTTLLPGNRWAHPPVMGGWFEDDNQQPRFFTPEEIIQMALTGRAEVSSGAFTLPKQRTKRARKRKRRRI